MLELLIITLAGLWLIDTYQTIFITKRHGIGSEKNPFVRFLLKHSTTDFVLFKIADFAIVSAIVILGYTNHPLLANTLLIGFNAIYLFTIFHNQHIIRKERQQ